jgi:hypothetical protein
MDSFSSENATKSEKENTTDYDPKKNNKEKDNTVSKKLVEWVEPLIKKQEFQEKMKKTKIDALKGTDFFKLEKSIESTEQVLKRMKEENRQLFDLIRNYKNRLDYKEDTKDVEKADFESINAKLKIDIVDKTRDIEKKKEKNDKEKDELKKEIFILLFYQHLVENIIEKMTKKGGKKRTMKKRGKMNKKRTRRVF